MLRAPVFLLCLLFPVLAVPATGQGFNSTSGRNHPELRWRVAETEHFRIMYPARISGIEYEAASIAENSFDVLSENLDVGFDGKIRIYLSDEDEIVNGFAVPLGRGYTNIWVHQNDVISNWTGDEKWLRTVIAHELAHIFHYRAVRSRIHPYDFVLGNPLPRFWTEGLAQYQTEPWNAYRGERWLRTAVLDDQLSYRDGRSVWNGRLLYAVGSAQVRYFAEQYGDSSIVSLLSHRSGALFGLVRVHHFNKAFKATTGQSYRDFYDDWRRHVNVYYNTLAGKLPSADSLGADPLDLPGQYIYGLRYSPDTTQRAVVALASLEQPIRRLLVTGADGDSRAVAEGAIHPQISWHPGGTQVAFARRDRGDRGSLINDLYVTNVGGGVPRRLTNSRRASHPTFAPDGRRLAFVGTENGTANIHIFDLDSGSETALTSFSGDQQLAGLTWHPTGDRIAYARFDPHGSRRIEVLEVLTGVSVPVTDGNHDDRMPIWSPDGSALAYTSLRDGVPNVFICTIDSASTARVTNLITGAEAHDWLPPDAASPAGRLAIIVGTTKRGDDAYLIDAAQRTAEMATPELGAFAGWTHHHPPRQISARVPIDTTLIEQRYRYRSLRNLTHAASLAGPYFAEPGDWGVWAFTTWMEPLSKHLLFLSAGASLPDLRGESFFAGVYINNQRSPTVQFNLSRLPNAAQPYGNQILEESVALASVSTLWPLDWRSRPYVSTRLGTRVRYLHVNPTNVEDFLDEVDGLPVPQRGNQVDFRLSLARRTVRPYIHNVVHPLDGRGVRLRVTVAARDEKLDRGFIRGEVAAFGVVPALSKQRLFLYGRAQAQKGTSLAQDYIGLSRYDELKVATPNFVLISFREVERVRGFREFAVGNRVLFGTVEYRVPVPSLRTTLLGSIALGASSLSFFADGGLVFTDGAIDDAVRRIGIGVELKNAVTIGGVVRVMHALGLAQPASAFGTDDRYEVYYRVRTALPF